MKTRLFSVILLTLLTGIASLMSTQIPAAAPSDEAVPKVQVKILRANKLLGLHDGQTAKASIIEVTLDPLAASPPHHHPGPVTGYVLEGTLEFQIGDQPLQVLHAGDTFFEPAMILHQVTRNPDHQKRTRILVTMIHPADAKRLVIPANEVNASNKTRSTKETK